MSFDRSDYQCCIPLPDGSGLLCNRALIYNHHDGPHSHEHVFENGVCLDCFQAEPERAAVVRKPGEPLGAFALRAYSAAVNAGSLDPWEDAARAVWADGHNDGRKLAERDPYP